MSRAPRKEWTCEECGKKFAWSFSYRRHLRVVHEAVLARVVRKEVSCDLCPYSGTMNAVTKHKKLHHGVQPPKRVVCPVCSEALTFKTALAEHAADKHPTEGEDFRCRTETFSNVGGFQEWMELLRRESGSSLIIGNSEQNGKTGFSCARARKENAACPAFVVSSVLPSGEVSVKYVSGHLGHDKQHIGRIHMSGNDRQRIRDLLKDKNNSKWIVRHLRESTGDDQRLHYVTASDVRSVMNSRGSHSATPAETLEMVRGIAAVLAERELPAATLTKVNAMCHAATVAIQESSRELLSRNEGVPGRPSSCTPQRMQKVLPCR